ncbi:hypothetical protein CH063_03960 [Colletotrichum higginsianum]|uniref:Uncharacterized protein n=2 Tax=Colletotrichum higginsianum TaxID=80884 RepID=H1W2V0_COLHI|nr:hypothetical protein CH63R_09590 [Colletotrichum higginsianum IMI 349063]OBR08069.1 hypothetical protein CH63R_09590 [Colletotrichum higginsianum IMI 349063]TIC91818.1 hypothetical protein CH35J_010946 [Colletotrichum higginsianum]CCF46813.1 hypothetical protein CH063_03960 [Colletotrichum higginsianum]
MQLATVILTFFATFALAAPNAANNQPEIFGRARTPTPGSKSSCCGFTADCNRSCCPDGPCGPPA